MKTRNALKIVLVLCTAFSAVGARAQKAAIKTNLLFHDIGAYTLNAGVEVGLAPRWTLDLSANYNGWTSHDRRWKHWLVQPEARYWFCDRFAGHFPRRTRTRRTIQFRRAPQRHFVPGLRLLAAHRQTLPGWFVGAGVAYAHARILGRHWNLEAEIGIGYAYTRYDTYPCPTAATRSPRTSRTTTSAPRKPL